jgi:hypothetical protein
MTCNWVPHSFAKRKGGLSRVARIPHPFSAKKNGAPDLARVQDLFRELRPDTHGALERIGILQYLAAQVGVDAWLCKPLLHDGLCIQ